MDELTQNGYNRPENTGENRSDSPFGYGIPSFQRGPLPPSGDNSSSAPQNDGQDQAQSLYGTRRPGFGECIRRFFQKYTDFSGRSRRSEFWNIILFYILIWFLAQLFSPMLFSIAILVMFIPFIALQCRRLHDIGRSGHWIWLYVLSVLIFNLLTFYSVIYALTYFPELNEMMESQGLNPKDLYFLYPLLDISPNYIMLMSVYVVVVNILFLIFNCMDSQRGTNQYGPSPKYPDQQPY